MQEMELLEGAYYGDIEGVRSVLSTGVPVDVIYPVRFMLKLLTLCACAGAHLCLTSHFSISDCAIKKK